MVSEEMYLLLLSFFYKIAIHQYTPQDLKICIRTPPRFHHKPKLLQNFQNTGRETKLRLASVLTTAFNIVIEKTDLSGVEDYLTLKKEFIEQCVKKIKHILDGGKVS